MLTCIFKSLSWNATDVQRERDSKKVHINFQHLLFYSATMTSTSEQHSSARRYFQSVLPSLTGSPTATRSFFGSASRVEHGPDPSVALENPISSEVVGGERPNVVPTRNQLENFRMRVGITNAPSPTIASFFGLNNQNIGLYSRICFAEGRAHVFYKSFSFLVNACLGLQIILAAALTALGASNGPHKAVTVFGAVNTVIAGFLTYLKGSGLPNRIKYSETEWTRLREYIEQREREFCSIPCTLDVDCEIYVIEKLYEQIRDEIEINTPDAFISVTDAGRRRDTRTKRYDELAEAYKSGAVEVFKSSSTDLRPKPSSRPVDTKEKEKDDNEAHAVA
jgi:hypothetical protein